MTAPLFHREAVVVVDTLRVEGLRIQFKATKSLDKHPNTLDVAITNLSEATRSRMRQRHAQVVLLAGYRGQVAQIFAGDARSTEHTKQGPDWETRVQCGDGERAYTLSRVNESFAPGARLADILKRLAERLGVDASSAIAKLKAGAFPSGVERFSSGYAAHGRASEELDTVLRAAGLEWSIQDGRLQILRPGEAAEGRAVVLSSDSGLVGSPEHGTPDKKGGASVLKAKALLQPAIKPGGKVELQTREFAGQYRVKKVTHVGDTAGSAWHSEMEMTQA